MLNTSCTFGPRDYFLAEAPPRSGIVRALKMLKVWFVNQAEETRVKHELFQHRGTHHINKKSIWEHLALRGCAVALRICLREEALYNNSI